MALGLKGTSRVSKLLEISMKLLKSSLLGSAAALAAAAGAQAADLPVKKAVPVEYVRVCSAYGAGFFYIPGTDTCLRLSGRARFEMGYAPTDSRTGQRQPAILSATAVSPASTSMPAPRLATARCVPSPVSNSPPAADSLRVFGLLRKSASLMLLAPPARTKLAAYSSS